MISISISLSISISIPADELSRSNDGALFGASRRQYNSPSNFTNVVKLSATPHVAHLKHPPRCHFFPSTSTDSIGYAAFPHRSHADRVSAAVARAAVPPVARVVADVPRPVAAPSVSVFTRSLAVVVRRFAYVAISSASAPSAGFRRTSRSSACRRQYTSSPIFTNVAIAHRAPQSAHLKHAAWYRVSASTSTLSASNAARLHRAHECARVMNPSTKSRAIGASRVVRARRSTRSTRVSSDARRRVDAARRIATRAPRRASIDGDG